MSKPVKIKRSRVKSALKKAAASQPETKKREVKCEVFATCRCTICGSYFEDDVCDYGHVVGQTYYI